MATTALTSTNLETSIKESPTLVIDFWASWCGPCRAFGPIFEKASEQHPDMKFMKCNTEEEQSVAAMFGISSIPTMAVFRDGILIFMQPGMLPPAALEQVLTQVKSLDMDKVRAAIAEEEAAKGDGSKKTPAAEA